jgi:hypothetical protein
MLDGILWSDLTPRQQHVLALVRDGASLDQFDDPFDVRSLRSMGLIAGSRLTREAERLLASHRQSGRAA